MAAPNRTGQDVAAWTRSPYETWAKRYVRKNLWRVSRQLEFDDAVQECAEIFLQCRACYAEIPDGPHFMSLFQRAVINAFSDRAKRNRLIIATEAQLPHPPAYEWSEGPLYAALSKASVELREVLTVIANGPAEFIQLLLIQPLNRLGGGEQPSRREVQISRRWCRLLRLNVRTDLLAELRRLLTR